MPPRRGRRLGWKPKVSFEELVAMMVDHDLELARQERTLAAAGHKMVSRGLSPDKRNGEIESLRSRLS